MAFIEDITSKLGIHKELVPYSFRYMVFGCGGGQFEGINSIYSFDNSEIILNINGGRIIVKGKLMTIKKYCEKEIMISGNILSVERVLK